MSWIAPYIPSLPTMITYSLAVVILALTPGPDMTLFIAQTISRGRGAGLWTLAGTSMGLFIHSIFVAVGLSALLAASPQLFNVLKWIGAAYLAWLAWQALRKGSGFSGADEGIAVKDRGAGAAQAFVKGLAINLLNPKIILFFVTFLPQFIVAGDPYAGGKLFFLGVWFILISLPVIVPLILAADRVAVWFRNSPRWSRVIDWLFAGVMGAFAVKLLFAQAR